MYIKINLLGTYIASSYEMRGMWTEIKKINMQKAKKRTRKENILKKKQTKELPFPNCCFHKKKTPYFCNETKIYKDFWEVFIAAMSSYDSSNIVTELSHT